MRSIVNGLVPIDILTSRSIEYPCVVEGADEVNVFTTGSGCIVRSISILLLLHGDVPITWYVNVVVPIPYVEGSIFDPTIGDPDCSQFPGSGLPERRLFRSYRAPAL